MDRRRGLATHCLKRSEILSVELRVWELLVIKRIDRVIRIRHINVSFTRKAVERNIPVPGCPGLSYGRFSGNLIWPDLGDPWGESPVGLVPFFVALVVCL